MSPAIIMANRSTTTCSLGARNGFAIQHCNRVSQFNLWGEGQRCWTYRPSYIAHSDPSSRSCCHLQGDNCRRPVLKTHYHLRWLRCQVLAMTTNSGCSMVPRPKLNTSCGPCVMCTSQDPFHRFRFNTRNIAPFDKVHHQPILPLRWTRWMPFWV